VLVIAAFLALSIWLGAARTAGFSVEDRQKPRGAREAATLYAKNCASCHGKDGRAKTFKAKFNHARDLTDAAWQQNVSDEHLFNSISNGKEKMPPFGKMFSENEINALVAYVRQLKK
jgi:mono/diheme cytochrome c family protein